MSARGGLILIIILLVMFLGCEKGLEPVSGIEGKIYIPTDTQGKVIWPDSLYGAVVVVAEFRLPFYSSADSFFKHIVTYSDPIDTARAVQDYFIQLKPGIYVVGVVGLKVPPIQVAFLPKDSLYRHVGDFKPIALYKIPNSQFPLSSVNVEEDEITSGIDLYIDYNLVLPF